MASSRGPSIVHSACRGTRGNVSTIQHRRDFNKIPSADAVIITYVVANQTISIHIFKSTDPKLECKPAMAVWYAFPPLLSFLFLLFYIEAGVLWFPLLTNERCDDLDACNGAVIPLRHPARGLDLPLEKLESRRSNSRILQLYLYSWRLLWQKKRVPLLQDLTSNPLTSLARRLERQSQFVHKRYLLLLKIRLFRLTAVKPACRGVRLHSSCKDSWTTYSLLSLPSHNSKVILYLAFTISHFSSESNRCPCTSSLLKTRQ
jgi:hypothetical protein